MFIQSMSIQWNTTQSKKKSADTYTTRTLKTLLSGISQTQKDKYRMMPLI